MRQELLSQYKEAQVAPLTETKIPEDVKRLFKNDNIVVSTEKTTPMATLLGVYFTPFGKNGRPRQAGAGIAFRVRKGDYAFSTVNCGIPEGLKPDVLIAWSNSKLTFVAMSVDAAADFQEVLAGKRRKRIRKDTLQPGLIEVFMDDPDQVVQSLKVYSTIKGDGDEDSFGVVTGIVADSKKRDIIPEELWKYLKPVEKVPYGGGVLRVFEVHVPPEEKKRYEAFLAVEECYRSIHQANDELQAAKLPFDTKITEIREAKEKEVQKVLSEQEGTAKIKTLQSEIEKTETELERLKETFDQLD